MRACASTSPGTAVSDKATADAIEKSTVKLAAKVALLWREGVVPVAASEPLRAPMIHAATTLIDALERRPGDILPAASSEALKACAVLLVDIIKPYMKVGGVRAWLRTWQPASRASAHVPAPEHSSVCPSTCALRSAPVHAVVTTPACAGKELEACRGAGRILRVRILPLVSVQQCGTAQGTRRRAVRAALVHVAVRWCRQP
ncbi:hypothetical protein EON67_01650 [archaeon]|nr:MAG: hypothetical protein EON67_01650 [archaeon]